MCVPQQQSQIALLDKIAPMNQRELEDDESSVLVKRSSEIVDENDEQEKVVTPLSAADEVESETETKSQPQEPLYPETSLPLSRSCRKSKKAKKSVRFDQAVTARPCLHRKDYTSREAAASWYGRREFESIRRELLKTLSLMHAGKFVECDDCDMLFADESSNSLATVSTSGSLRPLHEEQQQPDQHVSSSRGLEGFTVKGSLRSSIRKLRQKAITEVLVEQDFQVDRAESLKLTYLFYDDIAIREVYRRHAKNAAEIARTRGMEDHLAAIGAPREASAPTTKRRQTFRKMFFKSSDNKSRQKQRRWSSSEASMAQAAAMVSKPQRRSWTISEESKSEKKLGKKQLWSLFSPSKSTKPNNPAAMVA